MTATKIFLAMGLLSIALSGPLAAGALAGDGSMCTPLKKNCGGEIAFERTVVLPAPVMTQNLPPQTVYPLQLAGAPGPVDAEIPEEVEEKLRGALERANEEIKALRKRKEGTADPIAAAAGGEDAPAAQTEAQAMPFPAMGEAATPAVACSTGKADVWAAEAGVTLKNTLECWSKRAGWNVAWKSDRTYILQASADFSGDFETAAGQLIEAFAKASPPVFASFYKGNRVVVVDTPVDFAHQ